MSDASPEAHFFEDDDFAYYYYTTDYYGEPAYESDEYDVTEEGDDEATEYEASDQGSDTTRSTDSTTTSQSSDHHHGHPDDPADDPDGTDCDDHTVEPESEPRDASDDAGTSGDTDREDQEPEKEDSQSLPTGTWTQEEFARGCLVAWGPSEPSMSAPAAAAFVADTSGEVEARALAGGQSHSAGASLMDWLAAWAGYHGVVHGKWLVFAGADVADALWRDVRAATLAGDLGGYSEAHPLNPSSATHLIAAFCPDFRDAGRCNDVLRNLHALCKRRAAAVAAFKPAFLSALGVGGARGTARGAAARATYAELGLPAAWQPPALRAAHAEIYGASDGARKRGRKRRRRRRGRGAADEREGPPYANPYASDEQHFPSRPNGVWTEAERNASFIVYGSGAGQAVVDADGLYAEARRRLDEYAWARQHAEPAAAEKRALMRGLWELARGHGATVGKWKVFPTPDVAYELWEAVKAAVDDGRLGGEVKIGTFNPRCGAALLCVYCDDFSDVRECTRVLHNLADVCAPFGIRPMANFKPDFMTMLGMYAAPRNEYNGIDPEYVLSELGLSKFWPNEELKAVLDELKRAQRWRAG